MKSRKTKKIYLDYAATTPIDPKVLRAMLPYLKKEYGNPSSIYNLGQRAQMAIDEAREKVSRFLNCSPSEIIFTGSATEANNLAIFGTVRAAKKQRIKPHIITSKIEHHAILEPCHQLEREGVEVTYLPVSKEGLVKVSDVKKAIRENTVLVSVMYANNEIGTIQPIREIANVIHNFKDSKSQAPNFKQIPNHKSQFPIFHTDAVQAVNYLDCDVQKLGVDLLTLSGHKIYGPKGVGALYIKEGIPIEPLIYGGGQENGMRSGTENVAGIVGLGAAIGEIRNSRSEIRRIKKLRDKLIDGILKKIPGARLNGSRENRLPNNVNVSISGVEGESMVIALDQEGICVSTGSACSSRSLEPSHVLRALGLSPKEAHGSLRLTLGRYTTQEEINKVLKVLPKVVEKLRKISPFK
jgi:cysteine desulfurase